MRKFAIPLLFVAVAGCADDPARLAKIQSSDARELDTALAGLTPGKQVDCVDTQGLNGPQIIGTNLLYHDVGKVWRTDVGSCPGLKHDSLLVVEQWGARMCERDRFRVLDRGSSVPGMTCGMGKFTPYSKAKKVEG
jgi:hypothetical protein